MENNLISIIVPVYNSEKYLIECLESIRTQSYQNIEVLLINDGSKDNSLEILEKFAIKDPRFIVINQENYGVTVARKNGVEHSHGEWICFSDSDDILPKNSIEKLVANKENFDIVIGSVEFIGSYAWPYKKRNLEFSKNVYLRDLILSKIHCGPYAKLFKKELFSNQVFNIPTSIKMGEDYIMNLSLASNVKRNIKQIPDVVYTYIERPTNHPSDWKNRRLRLKYKMKIIKTNKNSLVLLTLQLLVYLTSEIKLFIKKINYRK